MAIDTMPRTSGTPRQPPRTPLAPRAPKTPRVPETPRSPKGLRTRPVTAPRHTRPGTRPSTRPTAPDRRTRPRPPRAPFILLLVGLLGGALISLLVISTTLAQGSYQITKLQQQDASLARQEQLLSQQVAQASSPARIAQEAEQFGMRQNPNLQFIDLKTGKIIAGKVSKADAAINVPGYSP
jgi:hypothetical protein